MTEPLEGKLDGSGMRIAVVVARFNRFVTDGLLAGAVATLRARGVADDDIRVVSVPGAFEIPGVGARMLADPGVDAAIALGAVIRGETAHFDYVCDGVTRGVMRAGLDAGKPFLFGVLTVDTVEQATERATEGPDNKGAEAALGAIEMVDLHRRIAAGGSRA